WPRSTSTGGTSTETRSRVPERWPRRSGNGSRRYPRRPPLANPITVSSRRGRGRGRRGEPCARMNLASRCASSSPSETAAWVRPVRRRRQARGAGGKRRVAVPGTGTRPEWPLRLRDLWLGRAAVRQDLDRQRLLLDPVLVLKELALRRGERDPNPVGQLEALF